VVLFSEKSNLFNRGITNVTDRQTDRQTDRLTIANAHFALKCIAR